MCMMAFYIIRWMESIKSWAITFECCFWLIAALNFKGTLQFLSDELAVLGDIADSWDPAFEVLLGVEDAIDASVNWSNHAHNPPIQAEFSALDELVHALTEITDLQWVANGRTYGPAASCTVQAPQGAGLGWSPLVVAGREAAGRLSAEETD